LTNPGCVTAKKQAPKAGQFSGIAKGYLYEVGDIKAGSFETAAYLPDKIRFELVKRLREKGLLAGQSEKEKRLIVKIDVSAIYSSFDHGEYYSELRSKVQVSDIEKKEIIASIEVHDFSSWGSVLSDFVEITHAEKIAKFLGSIVR
jgi:hypothetical protein